MKKTLSTLAIALVLASCGSSKNQEATTKVKEPANPTKYAGAVSNVIREHFDTNLGLSALSNYASTIAALYNVQVENIVYCLVA